MKSRQVDAALFDWSGTLANDLQVVWRTNDATLMSFGVPHQDIDAFKENFILPWQSFYRLYGLGTPEKLKEVDSRFWKTYRTLCREIRPFPETFSVLRKLKSSGMKTAIVTQTKRGPLLDQIEKFGFTELIDATVGEEDTDELKPSPKPILLALRKLEVEAGRSVFIGDMVEDVLSGNRAGVKVISIVREGSYHTEGRVLAGHPYAVAHSLAEVVDIILGL